MEYSEKVITLKGEPLLRAFQESESKDYISFSAGFPSPDTYPINEIEQSLARVMKEHAREAMSYCSTSGIIALRNIVRERLKLKFDLSYNTDEIIITNGSQQGLNMSAMLYLTPNDIVIFEAPTYLGAVNALRAYQANLVAIPSDEEGINIRELAQKLEQCGKKVKMIYVSPDYQNPTGKSWTIDRRKEFIQLISKYNIPVFEDAAYSELSFDNTSSKPLAYFDKSGQVIYIGTFSKVFCPGLRVAWMCAKSEIIEKFLLLKNTVDLSSCTLAQYVMADYLENNNIERHIESISALYKQRRDFMIEQLRIRLPKTVKFTIPDGGLYLWLELPEQIDSEIVLSMTLQKNVSFIEGSAFYPDRSKKNELRLNFSNMEEAETQRGVEILAESIIKCLA